FQIGDITLQFFCHHLDLLLFGQLGGLMVDPGLFYVRLNATLGINGNRKLQTKSKAPVVIELITVWDRFKAKGWTFKTYTHRIAVNIDGLIGNSGTCGYRSSSGGGKIGTQRSSEGQTWIILGFGYSDSQCCTFYPYLGSHHDRRYGQRSSSQIRK